MKEITVKSPAKINITLDVLGRREDGFHDVCMIMQTVDLYDTVTLKQRQSGISVSSNLSYLPTDSNNIAWCAAELFFEESGINGGVDIYLEKHIPVAAGLAGGSGNAAAVLKGLNNIYGDIFTENRLAEISAKIGSDIPYCIKGGTMLAEGRGEILTPLAKMPEVVFVLAKPDINVSTAWVYRSLNVDGLVEHPDTAGCIKAIEDKDLNAVAVRMYNVLETVTSEKYKIIGELKSVMIDKGAMGSVMSGSGPTVIGMFDNMSMAEAAAAEALKYTANVHITHTV